MIINRTYSESPINSSLLLPVIKFKSINKLYKQKPSQRHVKPILFGLDNLTLSNEELYKMLAKPATNNVNGNKNFTYLDVLKEIQESRAVEIHNLIRSTNLVKTRMFTDKDIDASYAEIKGILNTLFEHGLIDACFIKGYYLDGDCKVYSLSSMNQEQQSKFWTTGSIKELHFKNKNAVYSVTSKGEKLIKFIDIMTGNKAKEPSIEMSENSIKNDEDNSYVVPEAVRYDIKKAAGDNPSEFRYLLRLKDNTDKILQILSDVIRTVYKDSPDVQKFLQEYFVGESRLPTKEDLEKQYLQEVEKNLSTKKKSTYLFFWKTLQSIEGTERDKFIIKAMHESVERAYETGDMLTHYISEDTETINNKEFSNEKLLKKEKNRLENIINEVLTIYSNKMFGVELAKIRLKPAQSEFDKLKTQYSNVHDEFQKNRQDEEIKQDFVIKTEKLKTAKAYVDVANRRLANMEYLAEKAKIILDECIKTLHRDQARVMEALDKDYFNQVAERLRIIKEENDNISREVQIFYDEEKKYLPEMQKSLTGKKA